MGSSDVYVGMILPPLPLRCAKLSSFSWLRPQGARTSARQLGLPLAGARPSLERRGADRPPTQQTPAFSPLFQGGVAHRAGVVAQVAVAHRLKFYSAAKSCAHKIRKNQKNHSNRSHGERAGIGSAQGAGAGVYTAVCRYAAPDVEHCAVDLCRHV